MRIRWLAVVVWAAFAPNAMGHRIRTVGLAEDWPKAKATTALSVAHTASATRMAVLLATGAMNPMHRGHAQMLHQAKQRLEEAGYYVVGAWLSPSHDMYVLPKARNLNQIGLPAEFRLEVARRTVALDPLVEIGSWETRRHGYWPDYPEVAKALQNDIGNWTKEPALRGTQGYPRVFYVCGTDHAQKTGLYRGLNPGKDIGVVVVPRDGDSPGRESLRNRVYVAKPAEGDLAGFSSTQVRRALERKNAEYINHALSEDAARFLLQPTEEEYSRFADVYTMMGVGPE